jgi:hypothetical protein
MKFELKNVGLIDEANITLADLTIICGENNTGKTYVTYALYGFLRSWRQILPLVIEDKISAALKETATQIDLNVLFSGQINKYLDRVAKHYTKGLPRVFSSNESFFDKAVVKVSIPVEIDFLETQYQRAVKDATGNKTVASLRKAKGSPLLEILVTDKAVVESRYGLHDFIAEAVADIVFAPHLPDVFIASAERTGAAIFRKELDFARNRLVQELGRHDTKNLRNSLLLFEQMEAGYPWPVQDNVDFVRALEDIDKQISPLVELYPDVMEAFDAVIGGSYKVVKGKGLYYQPKGAGKPRLSMSESSSSVRALLDIGFYLRCRAKPGDLLIIDEPELNLHPVNQRSLARLVARIVGHGIRVFMTTHSDYIIKELNTLIMLHQSTPHPVAMRARFGYADEELVNPEKVKLFMTCTTSEKREGRGKRAKLNSLREATIHPDQGIEVETFDTTIERMNQIQTEILFGGEL